MRREEVSLSRKITLFEKIEDQWCSKNLLQYYREFMANLVEKETGGEEMAT